MSKPFAQAPAEPVAWRYPQAGERWLYTDYHDPQDPDCAQGQPLYTHPKP